MFINYLSALLIFTLGVIQSSNGSMDAATEFSDADTNGDGFISAAEFRAYMMDDNLSDDQLNDFFSEFDANNDGRINMTETAAVFQRWDNDYKQELQQWFQNADTNGDGRLSLNETLMAGRQDGDSDSDTTTIFKAADTNSDGNLSNDEFMNYDWGEEEELDD